MRNIILTTALLTAFNANANLLTNGSFEEYTWTANNGEWTHLTEADLNATVANNTNTAGWVKGSKTPTSAPQDILEVRKDSFGEGYEGPGSNFIELAPRAGSSIKQEFTVANAGMYTVSWFYARRDLTKLSGATAAAAPGTFDNDDFNVYLGNTQQFQFSVDDASAYQSQYRDPLPNVDGFSWAQQSFTVNLLAGTTSLEFQSLTNYDVGINLDNVSVTSAAAVAAVPEPQTYAMLLAGLALVGFASRKRKA